MYPRNAASPERISIGAVVQISDGAVQTSGVTVKVIPFGGTEASGGGTTAYSADGIVLYTPTQAETNYTSFVVVAVKSGCIPASVTIVTTASSTAGKSVVASIDNGAITAASIASDAITDAKVASDVTIASVTGAVGSVTGNVGGSVASVVAAVTVGTINANAITAPALATDAVTEIQSGLATAASIAALNNLSLTDIVDQVEAAHIANDTWVSLAAIKGVTDKLDTAVVLDGAVYQFTANALELGPSGSGGTSDWTADERTAIATILGIPASGTTPEVPSAGALKVIDDLLDTEIPALTTAVADLPTNAELATALASADDATLAAIAAEAVKTAAIKAKTDNLPSDPADASDIAAAFSTISGTLSTISGLIDTEIAAIKAKTDGLPADTAASLTALAGYVDTLETEVGKIIKSGESRTYARSGEASITFTETRA